MRAIQKVSVCGGGNAAHVVVPLLKNAGLKVTLYTPFFEEAARFTTGAARGGVIMIVDGQGQMQDPPDMVTSSPSVAAQSDMVLLVLPAFAHEPTLKALSPYLPPETVVGAIPARSGFELSSYHCLGGASQKRTIFCGQTLPWACRIIEYGHKVRVLGTKESVGLATVPAEAAVELSAWLSKHLQVHFHPMVSSLAVSLGNIGQVIHPGIMYGLLKDYRGAVWDEGEIPLFYQGVTEEIAGFMEHMSGEIMRTAALLSQDHGVDLHEVLTVREWLIRSYAPVIEDNSSLARAFCTNRSYRGLKVPVKQVAGGFVPDFQSRYLTEDIPFGLLYSKAVAKMVGCPTPCIDEVITAAGGWTGRHYLDDHGALSGQDLSAARIPQNYGIKVAGQLVQVSLGNYQ